MRFEEIMQGELQEYVEGKIPEAMHAINDAIDVNKNDAAILVKNTTLLVEGVSAQELKFNALTMFTEHLAKIKSSLAQQRIGRWTSGFIVAAIILLSDSGFGLVEDKYIGIIAGLNLLHWGIAKYIGSRLVKQIEPLDLLKGYKYRIEDVPFVFRAASSEDVAAIGRTDPAMVHSLIKEWNSRMGEAWVDHVKRGATYHTGVV